MRIEGWQIEGFGIFQEWEVRGLSPGLTVFLGPNEAGKSTLLAFLRGVLFGFPSRRSRAPQYPPLRGGRHGGRVILCGPQGNVTIERFAARRNGLRVNGREGTDQDLQPLLGGADENMFCSVFAFSLTEMQSFEWLQADQIRERIFSAGIAGAGRSARQVIDTLEAEAASIYRPRGASRVKELKEQIEQTERNWKLAQLDADRYAELEQAREKWIVRAAELSEQEESLRLRHRSLEMALEMQLDLEQAREEFAALAAIHEFPSEAEARLAALAARIEAARAEAQRLEEEQLARDRLRAQIATGLDDSLASIADRVEDCYIRVALQRDRLKSLAAARRERVSRSGVWIALGACVAFAGGWLTARGEVVAGLAILLAGLLAAAFLVYQRAAHNARVARLEQEISAWEQPVREWLPSFSGETLVEEFLSLRERCRRDNEIRVKAIAIDQSHTEMQARLDSARRELASALEARLGFLREAGAADEPEFHARLQIFRKRQQLAAFIQDRETHMPSDQLKHAPQELRAESSRVVARLREVQTLRDEAIGEQRLADAARSQIAESAVVPTLKAELEWLSSELATAVGEWRIATLAKELVSRTLQEFTRTRQPAVLEEASRAISRVTAGAYERVLQDDDRESLVALDRNAQRKRPEELSRGTAEQLYLCLRLGLAAEFARRTASLPLIMDDVLVNFDPERARAVAGELVRFSRQHQVLIFTCHPETARLFAEAAPETNMIQMERHGASLAKQ